LTEERRKETIGQAGRSDDAAERAWQNAVTISHRFPSGVSCGKAAGLKE